MPMPFSRLVATAGDAMSIWTTVVKDGSGSGGLGAISNAKCANRDTAIPAARHSFSVMGAPAHRAGPWR
ncbi:MAG: hypothetical protein ACLTTU_02930 [Bilophila wadsworthia]